MIIKQPSLKTKLDSWLVWKFIRRHKMKILVLSLMLMVLMVKVVPIREWYSRLELSLIKFKQTSLSKQKYRLTTPPKVTLELDISFNNLEKLEAKRQEALEKGVLISSEEDFVGATIRYQDQEVSAKVRLKGDWLDHLKDDKWSFRVEIEDDKALLGMRRFSLQRPETRRELNEWLFLKALKKAGLVTLRYDFVMLKLNGQSKGIYALEEHFSKELLESNQRREGVILKFSEDNFWRQIEDLGGEHNPVVVNNLQVSRGAYEKSLIEPFQWSKVRRDQNLLKQFQIGVDLLTSYRAGDLSPEEVFDYETTSTYLALCDVFGAHHSWQWHNVRFYFNPVTGKLEPIAFDSMPGDVIQHLSLASPDMEVFSQLQQDADFMSLYAQKLAEYSQREYLDKLSQELEGDIDYYQDLLRRDIPQYTFLLKPFYENANFIRQSLNVGGALRLLAPAQAYEGSAVDKLEAYNPTPFPLELESVTRDQQELLAVKGEVVLPTRPNQLPQYQSVALSKPIVLDRINPVPVRVAYHIAGLTDSYRSEEAVLVAPKPVSSLSISPKNVSFMYYDSLEQSYVIPSGRWRLTQSVVIPAQTGLIIESGTTLMLEGGGIVVQAAVDFRGEADDPIRVIGVGPNSGLMVLEAKETSFIRNTSFEGLGNAEGSPRFTTGGVTFYRSPVELDQVNFVDSQTEDALNLVRSTFVIKNANFAKTQFDALDVDFGTGLVENSQFTKIGNDAIDFSGSQVQLRQIKVEECGDKGISVGESSEIEIDSTFIKACKLGVASKDSSKTQIKTINLDSLATGIAVYQKKPEFGPAFVSLENVSFNQVGDQLVIEKGSLVRRPGELLEGDQDKVAERYY